jgi:hypothetical protein
MAVTSVTAFAAEGETTRNSENTVETTEVMPRAIGKAVNGFVQSRGTLTLYPELYSYVGFERKLFITTDAARDTGHVDVTIYKPNGDRLDGTSLNANDEFAQVYWLPSSGTYRIEIKSYSSIQIHVTATWSTPDAT